MRDFKDGLNDLSNYVENYYYSIEPKNFDVNENESNYGLNELRRHPNIGSKTFFSKNCIMSKLVDGSMQRSFTIQSQATMGGSKVMKESSSIL